MAYAGNDPEYTSIKSGNVEIENDVIYFGDRNTDGSWRMYIDTGKFTIQIRELGVWTTKQELNP